METRELLSKYDFDGDNIPFIKGSALKAVEACTVNSSIKKGDNEWTDRILELIDNVDAAVPTPRDVDKPFLMAVEDVFTITGRGTVATGKLKEELLKLVIT